MGRLSIPKLSLLKALARVRGRKPKLVNPSGGGLSEAVGTGTKVVAMCSPRMISTPLWVDREENHLDVTYDMNVQGPRAIVVEYRRKPNSNDDGYGDFTRLYLVGEDGLPVPRITGIWNELSLRLKTGLLSRIQRYDIDSHGRITEQGSLVKASESGLLLDEAIDIYGLWKKFPTVKDFGTVKKLLEGQEAINEMKNEEAHAWIANQIKESQKTINKERERIALFEADLNRIYEDAADAMNLFEENGIEPNMEGDGGLKKARTTICNVDFPSLYPGTLMKTP